MDDYRRLVLDRARGEAEDGGRTSEGEKASQARQRREAAKSRRETAPLRRRIEEAEARMAKFTDLLARVDAALAHPETFGREPARGAQLAQQRAELARALVTAEEEWLTLSSELEGA
jgi:ATP-binding cassette subfamily F protein 3